MRSFAVGAGLALLFSACSEEPRFRPVTNSGIDFVNRVEDTAELNIIDYLYFYDGGGVAVGDVNGDSLPDLYFSANAGPNRLYLNEGDLRFRDVTEEAGVAGSSDWNTGAAMADVDGDGLLDIYVCAVVGFRSLKGHNELFINNGDGTFTERAAEFGLDFRGFGTQASFFDYDLDGDLDAYLLNHSIHDVGRFRSGDVRLERHNQAGDRLYRNDRAGRFVDVSAEASIYGGPVGYGLGVSVSDLNLDGFPDIYVANDFEENDYLYLNNRDGTFTEGIRQAVGHTSRSSMGSDAADFNNDLLPDVVVLDMLPEREDILKTSAGIRAHDDEEYHAQYMQNALLLNRGEARFSNIGRLAGVEATDWSWAGLFCDLDNDGWKDLFVTNGIWRRPNDEDYLSIVSRPGAQDSMSMVSGAVLQYVAKMPHVAASNYAFRNRGDLTFDNVTSAWGLDKPFFSNGAAYADLDNDGDLDLAINNLNEEASIYENTGGGNALTLTPAGPPGNAFGVGSKVLIWAGGIQQLYELFPTRGFQSSVDYRFHVGLGAASSVDSLLIIWPDRRYQLLRDVPANRPITLHHSRAAGAFDYSRLGGSADAPSTGHLFADVTDSVAAVFRHIENDFVDFWREPLIPHKISTEGPALAVGDVNGDGLNDLFAGGAKWQAASLLVQTPGGAFVSSMEDVWRADSLHEDVDAAFFDAEGDGDLDLYVVSAGNEWTGESSALRDRLYVNDGAGAFSRGELPSFYVNGSVVRPADYDKDGDIDLFIGGRVVPGRYGSSPRSFLLRNDGGSFSDATSPSLREPGMVTDAAWIDTDGDGVLELVVAAEWMPIRVFRQNAEGFSEGAEVLEGISGFWTALETADLNADGFADLILGNLGLNSRLRAREDEPVRLYLDDFDADGETDPFLTSFRDGTSYPFAGRDELLAAFPSLARKFPTYASYGGSRTERIFSSVALQRARVLEATSFASVVAVNRGDGTFDSHELPLQAQLSPVYAILADDYDGDDHTDLILGGNLSGVAPARGRYDASYGSFLRGNGSGGFVSVEPFKSGLWLEGEIRALKTIRDAAGNRVIVAARNNDRLQFIRIGSRR